MRAEATQSVMMTKGYTFGFLCERCGVPRSDGSRRWCAQCYEAMGGTEAATSPWWRDADGVLARLRGDAAVVRKIVSLKGL